MQQSQGCTPCVLSFLWVTLLVTSLLGKKISAMALTSGPIIAPSAVYDVIIVGGGSAGLTAAKCIGPTFGKTCCIIEQAKMGGDCTWTGCIPSKSLIHASKQPRPPDFSTIQHQISKNIQQIYMADDSPEALKELGGIEVISGTATLQSAKLVTVQSKSGDGTASQMRTIQAKAGIILCTGAAPKLPSNIPGLSSYYTYESMWDELFENDIPPRLTVLGGGPIGCEMAQAMARLGSQVTIITSSARLLPQEDPKVGALLHRIFTNDYQIQIIYGRVTRVEQPRAPSSQSHTAYITTNEASVTTVQGDAILVAIGREPRCRDMGLEAIGVRFTESRDAIAVNAQLETSVPGIYAAGDCTGDRQL
jgi:pyruvate/2-oxoglutarate dehydrogenase complex dihydrolipoamide dehydrogenase (E3) component